MPSTYSVTKPVTSNTTPSLLSMWYPRITLLKAPPFKPVVGLSQVRVPERAPGFVCSSKRFSTTLGTSSPTQVAITTGRPSPAELTPSTL